MTSKSPQEILSFVPDRPKRLRKKTNPYYELTKIPDIILNESLSEIEPIVPDHWTLLPSKNNVTMNPSILSTANLITFDDGKLPSTMFVDETIRVVFVLQNSFNSLHISIETSDENLSFLIQACDLTHKYFAITPKLKSYSKTKSYDTHMVSVCINEVPLGDSPFKVTIVPPKSMILADSYTVIDASTGCTVSGDGDVDLVLIKAEKNYKTFSRQVDKPDVFKLEENNLPDAVYTLRCSPKIKNSSYFTLEKTVFAAKNILRNSAKPLKGRLLMSSKIEGSGLRVSVLWNRSPLHLDMHLVSSSGIHICNLRHTPDKWTDRFVLETEPPKGRYGPATIYMPYVESKFFYRICVEQRDAAWADLQLHAYAGCSLVDSGAVFSVWDHSGLVVDAQPLALQAPAEAKATDCFWWDLLWLDGKTREMTIVNRLCTSDPCIGRLKKT